MDVCHSYVDQCRHRGLCEIYATKTRVASGDKAMVEKSLQQRIRGWFPQEPQFTNAAPSGKVSQAHPPIEQYLRTSSSLTKNTSYFAVCFVISGCLGFFIAQFFGNYVYGIGDLFWILAGITVGLLTGLWSAQGQLKQLAQTNQVPIHGKHFKYEIVAMTLFGLVVFIGFQIHAMQTVFSPFSLMVAASYSSKYLIFMGYEKIRKVIIRQQNLSQYVIDPVIFALPKQSNPPTSNPPEHYG